jgi:hypothetical protein
LGIALQYIESVDLIVTVWDGVVTAADWSEAIQAELDDPESARGNRRMTDARTARAPDISEQQVESILDAYKNVDVVVARIRLAMVVTEGWNLAQVVQARMRSSGVTTVLFSDLHAACAWFDIDADAVTATTTALRTQLRSKASGLDGR